MQILLKKVVPVYLENSKVSKSEVWGEDIAITKGEHVHIIAPSGSGKTSLIHFIYGLRKDYSGSIVFENQNIRELPTEKFSVLRQKKMSIVFQDLRLFDDQTVRTNIELKRQLNPYHPASMINEMARTLGIENKLDKPAATCSYGEQQRIAIIRSLMQPFDFLLLDEPFSHLDDNNRSLAVSLILDECKKRNASLLLASLEELHLFKGYKTWHL